MIYIVIFLICGFIWGFSWPLFLFFAGAFMVYWLVTAKKRRTRIMLTHIYNLVESGRPYTVLNGIYFEAALKCALENGAKLEKGILPQYADNIDLCMNIGGTNYMISIAKMPGQRIWLGVQDMDESMRKYRERINRSSDD